MADITELVDKKGSYATNVRKEQGLEQLLTPTTALVCRSDCDDQMILCFKFSQRVRLSGLVLQAPAEDFPTTIKVFINRSALGFDDIDAVTPAQSFDGLTEKAYGAEVVTKMKSTLGLVDSLFLFCAREGSETCALSGIKFIGTGQDTADLSKLQKVGQLDGE